MKPAPPALPDVARALLKATIVALATAGLITGLAAEQLLAVLDLEDA